MNPRFVNVCKLFATLALAAVCLMLWPAASAQDDKAKPAAPQFDQAAALAALRQQIAADKDKPAEQVFKNVQFHKGVPAGRLLAIMELGYSRSLGVTCTHCHTPGAWEKEDLPAKQIAREMAAMSKAINEQFLKNIKGLKGPNPVVNCTTCHRGQTKPALNLPQPAAKPNS
jgi:cytochrome c peroxidase